MDEIYLFYSFLFLIAGIILFLLWHYKIIFTIRKGPYIGTDEGKSTKTNLSASTSGGFFGIGSLLNPKTTIAPANTIITPEYEVYDPIHTAVPYPSYFSNVFTRTQTTTPTPKT
jgi:hypothetical protein